MKLTETLSLAVKKPVLPAKMIASIILLGKIISMGLAVGPVSRLMTRSLYAMLESRTMWCERLTLSVQAKHELDFWLKSLKDYKSQPINFGSHRQR